ncbi:MAG: hypothetical protein H7A46_15730 [Verrucomicrobiales bacterium]|nr:hypothetical protein [Verrucomicrobiales bacterium]
MLMLAEIADKMPALPEMWLKMALLGGWLALLTLAVSLFRVWLGGCLLVAIGCFSVIAALPDHTLDPMIRAELGGVYLFHYHASSLLPFVGSLAAWLAAIRIKRRRTPGATPTGSCRAP